MLRKILKILICATFIFSFLTGAKWIAANDALISIQCPEIVTCGEEITLSIEISQSPGISSFGMDLIFPPELTYESFQKEGCLTEDFQFLDCNVSPQTGYLKIGGFSIDPVEEGSSGCLIILTFTIDLDCSGPFTLSLTNLVDNIEGITTQACEMMLETDPTTSTTIPGSSTSSSSNPTSSTTSITNGETTTTTTSTSSSTTTVSTLWPMAYDKMWGVEKDKNLFLLRSFRDDVLANNDLGRDYLFILYNHSMEILLLLLQNPPLIENVREWIDGMLPGIQSIIDGDEMIVSRDKLAHFESILNSFEAKASPALKVAIYMLKRDIQDEEVLEQFGLEIRDLFPDSY